MHKIDRDGTITVTRGDHCEFAVEITLEDGSEYEPSPDEMLIFTVKKYPTDAEPLIRIEADAAEKKLVIDGSHGKELHFGRYYYDVQLVTSDGKVFTVIPCSKFIIGEEVGWE